MTTTATPQTGAAQHLLRLENKRSFLAEGISEVLSYDETAIVA